MSSLLIGNKDPCNVTHQKRHLKWDIFNKTEGINCYEIPLEIPLVNAIKKMETKDIRVTK